MSDVTIKIKPNSAYYVEGDVTFTDMEGNPLPVEKKPVYALCRCGHSQSKPFCDGAHKRCGFQAP